VSNGYFSIQGYQINPVSSQRTNLGIFSVPYGGVTFVEEFARTSGTTTIPISSSSFGVAIIPPIGSPPMGVTLKMKTVSGDSGIFISTAEPTLVEWDTTNSEVPTDLYLVASGNITVTVQYL